MRSFLYQTRQATKCAAVIAGFFAPMAQAQTGAERLVGRLPPAVAREAVRGAISPDGRWYAYSVVLTHYRQIWLLDLVTGNTRLLTPSAAGLHDQFAWSPDSRHLSYVKDGIEVHVVAADGDSDRIVHTFPNPRRHLGAGWVAGTRWSAPDTVVAVVQYASLSPGPMVHGDLWHIPTDGDSATVTKDTVRSLVGYRPCCGRAHAGLWLEARGETPARCLAGPVPRGGGVVHWDPAGQFLYFTSDDRLYAVDLRGGAAHRVAGLPSNIRSLSMAADGRLAITVLAPHDSVADLWLLRPPLPLTADTLERCPDPPAAITRFVQANQPGWQSVAVLAELPARDFRLFVVDPGGPVEVVQERHFGIQYKGRLGWLDTTAHAFALRPGDHALYDAAFDSLIVSTQSEAAMVWRTFLARQSTASIPELVDLATAHPDIESIVAQNAEKRIPDASRDQLLALGLTGPHVARLVLASPRMQIDPSAVVAIAHGPRVWTDDSVQLVAAKALRSRAPLIAQDPRTEEPVLFAIATLSDRPSPALAGLMLQHPAVEHSPRTLAVLAVRTAGTDVSVRARERLAALGTTVESELVGIIEEAANDRMPATALYAMTFGTYGFGVSPATARMQHAMANLTDSAYASLRQSARVALAPTPPRIIRQLRP
jgi:hypothetical protein